MHAFGLLNLHIAPEQNFAQTAVHLLQDSCFVELESNHGPMRARAAWVYGQFAQFEFDELTLKQILDKLYQNLSHSDLPVRVNSAIALIKFLDQPVAVDFIRPGLDSVIKIYLKLIDDIDYDELIDSLKRIVEVFEDSIAPHAIELCQKLSEAFLRLFETQQEIRQTGAQGQLDIDSETSLTCDGLMSAIRRILQITDGQKDPNFYQALEEILEQSIFQTLNDVETISTEEGLSCLACLLVNQNGVSQRMWNFFTYITQSILADKGIFDQFIEQAFVVLINVMNKDPNAFVNQSILNSQNQQTSAVETVWNVACKTLQNAADKNDEIEALMVVTLLNSLLENIQGLQSVLPMIVDQYLEELSRAKTPDYTLMLIQGILMCIWYDFEITLRQLQERGSDSKFFDLFFQQVREDKIKEDFEVKRSILGLSALIVKSEMPPSVTENYGNIINALVFLSQKSIEIRNMEITKEPMADVDDEAPG